MTSYCTEGMEIAAEREVWLRAVSHYRLLKNEIQMAESNPRRTIIREWTSLAREDRQSTQQAAAFAMAVLQRHSLRRSRRAPLDVVMAWLRPRIGRA